MGIPAPADKVPRHLSDAETRCDEACLETQRFMFEPRVSGNGAVAILMHMTLDPDCAHCAAAPTPWPFTTGFVYGLIKTIVEAAKAAEQQAAATAKAVPCLHEDTAGVFTPCIQK